MKAVIATLCLCSCLYARAEGEIVLLRLVEPAFKFHLCVKTETEKELKPLSPMTQIKAGELEGPIWQRIFFKCNPQIIKDSSRSLIYLHYSGDAKSTKAFTEGVIVSGRAYVESKLFELVK